jgi:hypothetical protein
MAPGTGGVIKSVTDKQSDRDRIWRYFDMRGLSAMAGAAVLIERCQLRLFGSEGFTVP